MSNLFSGDGFWIGIFLVVLFILVLREVLTWYWKQTEIVALLKQIEKNTRKPGVPASIEKT